jgi:hypothetical protein
LGCRSDVTEFRTKGVGKIGFNTQVHVRARVTAAENDSDRYYISIGAQQTAPSKSLVENAASSAWPWRPPA